MYVKWISGVNAIFLRIPYAQRLVFIFDLMQFESEHTDPVPRDLTSSMTHLFFERVIACYSMRNDENDAHVGIDVSKM